MSQWGKTRTIENCKFIPSVKTRMFDSIQNDSVVEDIFTLDIGGHSDKEAYEILLKLRAKYIGQLYTNWLL